MSPLTVRALRWSGAGVLLVLEIAALLQSHTVRVEHAPGVAYTRDFTIFSEVVSESMMSVFALAPWFLPVYFVLRGVRGTWLGLAETALGVPVYALYAALLRSSMTFGVFTQVRLQDGTIWFFFAVAALGLAVIAFSFVRELIRKRAASRLRNR